MSQQKFLPFAIKGLKINKKEDNLSSIFRIKLTQSQRKPCETLFIISSHYSMKLLHFVQLGPGSHQLNKIYRYTITVLQISQVCKMY